MTDRDVAILVMFGLICAKILQLCMNRDHAARYLDWVSLHDPFGVNLWRRHWHRELAFVALAAAVLYLTLGSPA